MDRTFGDEPLFDKQREIMESVRDNRVTYVKACHASGKTRTAAYATLWWMFCYPLNSKVLTTAPTWTQVVNNLWREIRDLHSRSKIRLGNAGMPEGLGGHMTQWKYDLDPQWFAIGQSSDRGVNFQGLHSENILVIIDEADGIPRDIWEAIDGVLTSENSRLLAIGNPIDPTSEFKRRCDLALVSKRRAKQKLITIRAMDTPNVQTGKVIHPFLITKDWVDTALENHTETGMFYVSKVLAEWPEQRADTLIPISWLMRARLKTVEPGIRTLGVDVARFGTDRTVRTMLAGGQLLSSRATKKEDTMQTVSRVLGDISQHGPAHVAVDVSGVGGGVVDRLEQIRRMEKSLPPIVPVNNGERASDPERFINLGSEMWWKVREAFERNEIGLACDEMDEVDELISDLNRPSYEYVRESKVKVDKFGMPRGTSEWSLTDEERSHRSPDRGDSFVLAFNAALPYIKAGRTELSKPVDYYRYVKGSLNV